MVQPMEPGEKIRSAREARGWSQADLAEKVSCDTKTIGRWESGDSIPRPFYRQSLCEIFGKNAEELGLVKENAGKIRSSSFPSHQHNIPEASLVPTSTTALSPPPMLKEVRASDHLSPSLLREDWGEGTEDK